MSLPGAMRFLYLGYFIRRSGWSYGSVLFTKEDYRRTEINGVRKPEYNNIDIMLEENPASVPQFWFALGDIRYGNTPEDIIAKDWQVVQCVSFLEVEQKRLDGKLGGIKMGFKFNGR